MFIEIVIPDRPEFKEVEIVEIGGANTGKPLRTFYKQPCVFHFGEWNMSKSSIAVEDGKALKAGKYKLDVSDCFSIGRFDRLEFDQYQARLVMDLK